MPPACVPEFTVDWFSHNVSRWTDIFSSLGWFHSTKKLQVLEDWGLTQEQHQGSAVFQRFHNNVAAVRGTDRVVVLQQPSWAALALLMATHLEDFDVIYIDGSHQPQDVLTDAVMAWKLLKKEGIMILDDYEWDHVVNIPVAQTPRKAIDVFLDIFAEEVHVMRLDYQCIVQKHASVS